MSESERAYAIQEHKAPRSKAFIYSREIDSLKRGFDIVFSTCVLVFLSPIFVLIAISIFLFSPGKVLFSQERLGQGGKVFKCLKFRTMVPDAEESLDQILERFPMLKKEWQQTQKLRQDPRVFTWGRFLRKTSLDELPQFWNVLKGDLSVVGPRPYMTNQLEEMGSSASIILSIKPGITGLWQTSGRSQTNFRTRIALDKEYVDKQSFGYDLRLILKTIPVLFSSKNAC